MVVIGYALRLAPEDTSIELTGFGHNAVTCVGMKTDIPVSTCFLQLYVFRVLWNWNDFLCSYAT